MMKEPDRYQQLLEESLPPNDSPLYKINKDYALNAINRGHQIADLVEAYVPLKGMNVLDLGSGEGGVSIAFAIRGGRVTSLDISKQRLERMTVWASENNVILHPVLGDALDTGLNDNGYNIIISNDLLEHVSDGQKLAIEIDRLLRPGGVLFLETQNRLSIFEFLSDSHYSLLGMTILPRKLAAFYAVKIRKRTKVYSVTKIPTPGFVEEIFSKTRIELTPIHVEDPRQKVSDPRLLRSGVRRRTMMIANRLGLSGLIVRFIESRFFQFIPGSIAFIGFKK